MSEQSSNGRAKKPTPLLEHYPHRVSDIIRFGDLDVQGHVNNAVFATYFESGRVTLFRDPDLGIGVENATYVLVRQEIDFLRELHWPGDVVVGTALAEVAVARSPWCKASLPAMHARRPDARPW